MKKIVCFGDSNTYGYIPGGDGRYGKKERWTGLLNEQLHPHGYSVIEEGLCGRTTIFEDELRPGRRGADQLKLIVQRHQPIHSLIIMLGTNDCKSTYKTTATSIGEGIEVLLRQIREIDRTIQIVLISPIFLGDDVWMSQFDPEFSMESVQISRQLKQVYEKIAKEYGCVFMAASDYVTPSSVDQEHMDIEGHRVFADRIYQLLQEQVLLLR